MLKYHKLWRGAIKLDKNEIIRITPYGGLGQIGSNMMLWAFKNERILIDAGILFPNEDAFEINYLIPDYKDLPAPHHLILTHAHEDHIGGVLHALDRFPQMQVWASPFAASILRKKMSREKISTRIFLFDENHVFKGENYEIHPIGVNHSIPETFGLLLIEKEKRFCLFHVSDFKCNKKEGLEKTFDFEKLKKLSQNIPQKFLFSDSTSMTSKALKTPEESELIPSFEKFIAQGKGRIFITLFSSNIERIQNILDATLKDNRKLVPYGRSMEFYMEAASELGILKNLNLAYKNVDSVEEKNENIVVLVSGCQGDFKSALRRLAYGEDSQFKLKDTDTFIFSSKAIPGNEKKINQIVSQLSEKNIKVFTPENAFTHVSGHAGKEDITHLIKEFSPTHLIPIHGESSFLNEQKDWVKECFPQMKTEVLYNFDFLSLTDAGSAFITQGERLRPIMIHGKGIPLLPEELSERRKMASLGLVSLSIKLDTLKNHQARISVHFLGLPKAYAKQEALENFLQDYVKRYKIRDKEKYEDEMKIAVRQFLEPHLGYRPVVVIHLV